MIVSNEVRSEFSKIFMLSITKKMKRRNYCFVKPVCCCACLEWSLVGLKI